MQKIIIQRERAGGWSSFEQFTRDCELPRDELTLLSASDLFGEFGDSRSAALWQAEAAPYKPMLDSIEDGIDWRQETKLDSIRKDFRAFKTSLKQHPAEVIRREQWPYAVVVEKFTLSSRLAELSADTDVFVFGMVLVKQSPGTAKGMVFVTLEDEAGFINLAFTPQVYARFYRQVDQQPFLCVVGRLQRVNESHSILVKRVFDPDPNANLLALPKSRPRLASAISTELIKPRAFH